MRRSRIPLPPPPPPAPPIGGERGKYFYLEEKPEDLFFVEGAKA
ncbi:hypothetical protein PCC7424_3676 [Gloeothece citriformis PCC 7424]|uniref:Uncharacterized protein n=1 Tax=Gloeothece citriformis (strain PCC 7424) TaxID=65393 RepID=B7KHW2_GLOC7|nr:hypothetical protein PCC7424_3676 [Gloeothece citriformis PCC 7424]